MARAALGTKVKELAALVGISPQTMKRIESGGNTQLSTIEKLQAHYKEQGIRLWVDEGGDLCIRIPRGKADEFLGELPSREGS